MGDNCLFCKIIAGDIAATKLYEDEDLLAFRDINPEAPLHFLVIPKKHIAGPGFITDPDRELLGKVLQKGAQLAKESGYESYRFVINNGSEAGQTVFHFHLHVLGGRPFSWPPG